MNAIFFVCVAALLLSVCYANDTSGDQEDRPTNQASIGDKFGGDMDVSPDQLKSMLKNVTGRNFGSWSRPWPGGVIPYRIENSVPSHYRNYINQAASNIRSATGGCVKFVPYNGQRDYVSIRSYNDGCWSKIGYNGGQQDLNLQNGPICNCIGVTTHEMMHAAGMAHEHQRNDRDSYIKINWNNVNRNQADNFNKIQGNTYGLAFDYNSIMLYGSYLFGINNRYPTTTKVNGGELADLCKKNGLSQLDVQKIKKFYRC